LTIPTMPEPKLSIWPAAGRPSEPAGMNQMQLRE
jgi:hypothetical protein